MVHVMKLHHTNGRPDWEAVEPARRNYWQRIAVVTRAIVTPGNALSTLGLGLVLIGVAEFLRRPLYGI